MKVSVRKLQKLGACEKQVTKFEKIFGSQKVEVTEALCSEHAQVFDWNWAACHLLSDAAFVGYNKVRDAAFAEYVKARGVAFVEYDKVRNVAFAETCGVSRAECNKMCDAALVEYDKVRDAALVEYSRACAVAFARASLNGKEVS